MAFTKKLIAGAFIGALAAATAAQAAELIVPAFEYRTGAYAPNGIPFWNGFSDYLTLLNERDGGIGGVKIKIRLARRAMTTSSASSATRKRNRAHWSSIRSRPASAML